MGDLPRCCLSGCCIQSSRHGVPLVVGLRCSAAQIWAAQHRPTDDGGGREGEAGDEQEVVDSRAPACSVLAGLCFQPNSFRRFPNGSSQPATTALDNPVPGVKNNQHEHVHAICRTLLVDSRSLLDCFSHFSQSRQRTSKLGQPAGHDLPPDNIFIVPCRHQFVQAWLDQAGHSLFAGYARASYHG